MFITSRIKRQAKWIFSNVVEGALTLPLPQAIIGFCKQHRSRQWTVSSGSTLFDIQSINFTYKSLSKWWFVDDKCLKFGIERVNLMFIFNQLLRNMRKWQLHHMQAFDTYASMCTTPYSNQTARMCRLIWFSLGAHVRRYVSHVTAHMSIFVYFYLVYSQ